MQQQRKYADRYPFADNTPANFVITNSTLPATVTLNSMQCDTFTISGYFTQPGSCLYNVASVTSPANTTWKDSVCVTVINACANTDTTFADSTFSGNATISNQSIYVANRFYINGNLTLNSCTVYTAAGAQIIVQNTGVLTLNNTTLQACDTMWRGIEVLANGIVTLNTSTIRDAENGILLRNKGIVKSVNSNFYDNIIGINAQPELAQSDVYGFAHLTVVGTTFIKANGFKASFIGQPTHGTVPLSGIWLNNMFCTIGDNIFNENYLSKMEFGIYSVNSHLTLTNSKFEFISNSGSWPTKPSGTAVVSWGNSQNTLGVLNMQPLASGGTTVQQCDRGIYAIYSELKAHNLTFRQVLTGIYAARCKLRTADITYNDIQAKSYGIYLSRNEGAKSVTIEGNTITMQGSSKGVGITLDELTNTSSANYNIYNNMIALHAAATGIKSSFALRPQINYNNINQYTVGSQKPLTTGIQLLGSDTATVTCNYIISNYPADTLLISKGMEVAQSKGFNINCNHIRFQNCGVYMGGDCTKNNVYRTNDVDSCDMGLYLNTAAIIGQQMQKGNRWLNVLNKVNATNLGDPSLSPIMVHTNVNTIWHPLNISPNGPWFIPQSGTPDQCGNDCYAAFTTSEDTLLLYNIARGDTLSTEFIEETKSIAQQNLYELLVANDTLRDSDTVLTVFYINNQNTVIGKLNETKDFQKSAFVINGYFNSLLAASDSLMQQITDSLTIVDSLLKQNPTTLYQALLDNLIQQLNSQQTTRKNLMQQIENIQIGNWVGSTNANASVQPTTLPQINQKTMNELLRKAEQLGEDSLQTDMNTLLNIALQCPYSGGVSVYQARNMLALFNDSLEYDDQYACLQEGIYRMAQRGNGFTNYAAIDFDLVPNPADGKTEVRILSPVDGLTKLTLRTMLGYMMGEWQLNGEKQFTVYTHKYLQGMYMIEIKDGNGYSRVKKLSIAR
ncbi:MAG: T9SS type A sorting domain-containing protein [Bacteroidetes bacterium]|nr:T9SS type A sorting domain-containing protein [Bacteroidota bacterium]